MMPKALAVGAALDDRFVHGRVPSRVDRLPVQSLVADPPRQAAQAASRSARLKGRDARRQPAGKCGLACGMGR